MATALLSLARDQKLRGRIAMTGEITLTGRVLAVGGIREKIIAARRSGIKGIILPEAVRGEFEELPEYVQKGMTINFVSQYEEVAALLFK